MSNRWLAGNAVATCIMFYYRETQNCERNTIRHAAREKRK